MLEDKGDKGDTADLSFPSMTDYLLYFFAVLIVIYACIVLIQKLKIQSIKSKLRELEEDDVSDEEEGQRALPKDNQEYISFCNEMIKLIQQAVDMFFKNSWLIGLIICIFIGILIFFFFEEKFGTGYVTSAYVVGVLVCFIVSMFVKAVIKYAHFELFAQANEKQLTSLEIAIESGIAIIAFFLGFMVFFLEGGLNIYLSLFIFNQQFFKGLYGEDNKTKQKLFIFLFIGFAFGYISLAVIQRIALACINQATNLAINNSLSTSPLNQLQNNEVDVYSIQTPGSSVNIFKEQLTSTTMTVCDCTVVILFVFAIVMVAMTDSQELLKNENSLNFPFAMIEYSLFATYIAFIITKLIYNNNKSYQKNDDGELVEKTASFVRCFIFLNFFFAIVGYFIFAFLFFPDKFTSGFSKDAKPVEEPKKKFLLIQTDKKEDDDKGDKDKGGSNANRWLIIMCFLFSLAFSFIFMPLGEYLTSHFYKPVRTLSKSLSDNLFFAYPFANSLYCVSYILLYLLILTVTIFITHWLVGYIGISLICFGFIPIILALFAIHVASSLLTTVHALHNQAKSESGEIQFTFNLIFPLNNYKIHYEIILTIIFGIVGYLTIAVFWHFSIDYDKMLSFTPIMIFGVIIGIAYIWTLSVEIVSLSMNPASKLLSNLRKQAVKIQSDPSFKPVDHISEMIDNLQSSTYKTFFLPILTSICSTALLGLLFGNDVMFGFVIGIIIYIAIKLTHCIISSNALINAKNFLQNEYAIYSKTDGIYPTQFLAHSIGELQKSQIFSLITLALFTICIAMLSQPLFAKTAWLAQAMKLTIKNLQTGGPW